MNSRNRIPGSGPSHDSQFDSILERAEPQGPRCPGASGARRVERRVQERTAELVAANQALQAEVLARGRVEDALRESEARFRSTFQGCPYRDDARFAG